MRRCGRRLTTEADHRGLTRTLAAALAVVVVGAVGCGGGGDEGGVPTLRWYSYDEPGGSYVAAAAACSEASDGRYRVELVTLPNNADEQREQLVRRLAAQDSDIDILGMDVLGSGESVNVTIADGRRACEYDLKIVFDDGDELEDTTDLCDTGSYTVTD